DVHHHAAIGGHLNEIAVIKDARSFVTDVVPPCLRRPVAKSRLLPVPAAVKRQPLPTRRVSLPRDGNCSFRTYIRRLGADSSPAEQGRQPQRQPRIAVDLEL